jgi:Protein of unknown function (DUF3305)
VSWIEPLARIPLGVVVERRRAKSPWVDFVWRPVAVLPGKPEAAPWTVVAGDADCMSFYAGAAELALYRSDASGYRDNLETGSALLWVMLRPTGGDPPYEIAAVTAEPGEGESFTESATNLVESVPMPDSIYALIAEFVAEHQVERPFVKRERDRADPDAMTRGASLKDRK